MMSKPIQKYPNEGARLLLAWMAATLTTRVSVALQVGVASDSAVGYWLVGGCRPNKVRRERLWQVCGVPVHTWDLPSTVTLSTPEPVLTRIRTTWDVPAILARQIAQLVPHDPWAVSP